MAARKRRNRSNSTIDKLPRDQKQMVEKMILEGNTYKVIVAYLLSKNVILSQPAVCRYAKRYLQTMEMLHLTQENFKMISEEIEKYPELDTTEVIIRIASQQLLNAIAKMEDSEWEKMEISELLHAANALTRAATQKKRVDLKSKSELEKALEANKTLLFDTLAKRRPNLYEQVVEALNEEKAALNNEVAP